MTCRVRLFARAKDLAGTDAVVIGLSPGATVADLRRRLAADHPALAGLLSRCAVAVADEFAEDNEFVPNSTRESCADNCKMDSYPSDNCKRNFTGRTAGETHQTQQTHPEGIDNLDLDPHPF